MVQTFQPVRPGDLITSELMNRILTELDALEVRVTALEGLSGTSTNAPVIYAPPPPASVHMGDELTIMGRNFGLPLQNVVTVDSVQVTQFKSGSNDGLLIFDMPAVQGVPAEGKSVIITVSNPRGFASTSITLLPYVPTLPAGSLVVSLSQPPAETALLAGQNYIFVFNIQAITNMAETYSLTPSIDLAGWQAVCVNAAGTPLAPSEIQIPQGSPPLGVNQSVRVKVTIPAAATTGTTAKLRLAVTSKQNPTNLTRTTGDISVTVGSAPPPAQDKVILSFLTVAGTGSGVVTDPGTGVKTVVVPTTDSLIAVNFKATIKDPGTYTIATPTIQSNPGSLWRAQLMGSATITTAAANATPTVQIGLAAKPGAGQTNLVVRVSSDADGTIFGEYSQQIRI